ncbi:MAG TPA: DNA-3-methyladenine glycosylase [Candidatus Dormibacteraeota bacterium]
MRRGDPSVGTASRDWFARPTIEVARDLIGCALLVDAGGPESVVARIVETEAYLGLEDPASHAYRGPTPRSAVMFGPPAHLYVYFTYGMHHCANVVTEVDGVAGAVLLRAAAVEHGLGIVIARRGEHVATAALLQGPGNLCRGLGITRADTGTDLLGPASRVGIDVRAGIPAIAVSTRVGLSVAADRLLRFSAVGDPAVSRPRPAGEAAATPGKRKGPD